MATKEFSTTRRQQIRTATSPYPPDLSWWAVKGRQSLISRVHLPVSLTGPAPPGGADTSRRCQGCSHPPQRLPGQAAPSFTRPLRRSGDEGLSPPLDFRRLVAHEMLSPVGATLARLSIGNDEVGFAAALAWIAEHAAAARVLVGLEGTRCYGIGLVRALTRAGLTVVEVERPKREQRRGRGKSDPIDAHLAGLAVLRMDADRLPFPRADGDREALRILLVGRRELADTQTRQTNQLKALLLTGDDLERQLATGAYTQARLHAIIRRRGSGNETREQAVRRAEARRLAQAIRDGERELRANTKQLREIVDAIAPGLLTKHGVGPVSAAQAIVSWSHPGALP
jgi:transposase